MKIALIGYGKMGKAIEEVAITRGHAVILRLDADSSAADWQRLADADAAIEFTQPDAAIENMKRCFALGVPVVVGTTGWLGQLSAITDACNTNNGSLLWASNFSIGVQIFMAINRKLAELMNVQPAYSVEVEEVHHTQKLDAPSGTAITLADDIVQRVARLEDWRSIEKKISKPLTTSSLDILSKRIDAVPGTHTVSYNSDIDSIEITHTAHSRLGFATGAVIAAEFLHDKKGVFTMQDLLQL